MSAISWFRCAAVDLRPEEIDLEIAQQRLREDALQLRGDRRIEVRQLAARVGPVRRPGDVVRAAAPSAAAARRRRRPARRPYERPAAPKKMLLGGVCWTLRRTLACTVGRNAAFACAEELLVDLRLVLPGHQIEVVLDCHPDGFGRGQPDHLTASRRLWRRACRLSAPPAAPICASARVGESATTSATARRSSRARDVARTHDPIRNRDKSSSSE